MVVTKHEDGRTIVGDYSFPPGVEPDEDLTYRIPYGDDDVVDLKWEGYIDVAHQDGVQEVKKELVASGEDSDGVKYAVVKTTIVDADGNEFSAFGSADETTQQVRDPEFVWLVAESRSVKRAVKNALNIIPVDESASDEPDAQRRTATRPDGVDFDDDHALADSDSGGDGNEEVSTADGW